MKRLFESKVGLIALIVGELCYIGIALVLFRIIVVPAVIESQSIIPVLCFGIVAPIPIIVFLWQLRKYLQSSNRRMSSHRPRADIIEAIEVAANSNEPIAGQQRLIERLRRGEFGKGESVQFYIALLLLSVGEEAEGLSILSLMSETSKDELLKGECDIILNLFPLFNLGTGGPGQAGSE